MSTTNERQPAGFRMTAALLSASTLLGIVCWGIAFAFASGFYDRFGAHPHDVGYTQQEAVTSAALIMAAGVAVLFFLLVILVGVLFILNRFIPVHPEIPWKGWIETALVKLRKAVSDPMARALLVCALVILSVAAIMTVYTSGQELATDVQVASFNNLRRGIRVFNPSSYGLDPFFYGVSAMRFGNGEAEWLQPGDVGPQAVRRSKVILLGQNNGSTIFYDYCSKSTKRVATGDFMLSQEGYPDADTLARYCARLLKTPGGTGTG